MRSMKSAVPLLVAGLIVAADGSGVSGQTRSTSEENRDPSFLARATAVLVDVVVRDRQGRPVLDLRADDFEIVEDGVPQTIGSFTLVSRGSGIGVGVRFKAGKDEAPTTVVNPTGDSGAPVEEPTPALALVFDALSSDALALSQRAALEHVGMSGDTLARVGVFATDPTVRVLQPYTSDSSAIRKALQQLTPAGTESRQTNAERLEQLRQQVRAMEAAGLTTQIAGDAGGGAALAGAGGLLGQAEMQMRLIQGEMRLIRSFETIDADHRGYGTTAAMLTVLSTLAEAPGRKSLVFFSEGLPASPVLQHQLQRVIEAANRSNITVYAVDATGLRVLSATDATAKEVNAMAEERLRQATSGADPTDGPIMRMVERTEDMLRYDSQGGLARLAEDTGGFLVRDTNNLRDALTRIDEDMRFHYLLSYAPKNDVLDGKFRTIGVKVKRPGVSVYARKGYRAVRTPRLPDLSYEEPVLALLERSPLPNAFPSQAAAYNFPEATRPGLTPVVVRVTTESLQFEVDQEKGAYSAQAAIVARVRDANGGVVHKLSQQYVLSGHAKDVEAAKNGEILFYREVELDPGVYQVESMVYDANAEKGSARVSTITVPPRAALRRLRMSSLVLVARTEQTEDVPAAEDGRGAAPSADEDGRAAQAAEPARPPFYYGSTLLYPNVGEPIRRDRDKLPFYFVVYPTRDRCACTARISLLKNGQSLADTEMRLQGEDDERLQHVGELPIGQLPSGTYELRVTVGDGRDQETRSTFFTLS